MTEAEKRDFTPEIRPSGRRDVGYLLAGYLTRFQTLVLTLPASVDGLM